MVGQLLAICVRGDPDGGVDVPSDGHRNVVDGALAGLGTDEGPGGNGQFVLAQDLSDGGATGTGSGPVRTLERLVSIATPDSCAVHGPAKILQRQSLLLSLRRTGP